MKKLIIIFSLLFFSCSGALSFDGQKTFSQGKHSSIKFKVDQNGLKARKFHGEVPLNSWVPCIKNDENYVCIGIGTIEVIDNKSIFLYNKVWKENK